MSASVHERHRGDRLHISHWPCRVIAAREAEATKDGEG
jgi:hypothetical protein